MKYYTIQNNGLLIAEKESALTRFYDNVKALPEDYENGKYIVQDGELVLNPNREEEQAQKKKEEEIFQIKIQMDEIDKKRIRAICENEPKDENTTWLEYYNSKIAELRTRLSELS